MFYVWKEGKNQLNIFKLNIIASNQAILIQLIMNIYGKIVSRYGCIVPINTFI